MTRGGCSATQRGCAAAAHQGQAFTDADRDGVYDSGSDTLIEKDHHAVNAINEIDGRWVDGVETPFEYDLAGNLENDGTYTYTFDPWNRITEVKRYSDDALIAQYAYDALGRRINKKVYNSGALNTSGDGDFFYYDGHRLIEEHTRVSGNYVLNRGYIWGLEYIDELVGQFGSSGAVRYVLADANYNVVGLTSGSGNTIQQYAWHPYGKRLAVEDGQGQPVDIASNPTLLTTPIGHQGLYHDAETGLVYNRARYYSPTLGRFAQRDPLATAMILCTALAHNAQTTAVFASAHVDLLYAAGLNNYTYERNNPVITSDPDGQIPPVVIALLLAGLGNAAYKSIEMMVTGNPAYQDWNDTIGEQLKAFGLGVVYGSLFLAGSGVAGLGVKAALGTSFSTGAI